MILFINYLKNGKRLAWKTVHKSIRTVGSKNKRPIVSLLQAPRGWPGKHVAMVTALSLSPRALSQSGTV